MYKQKTMATTTHDDDEQQYKPVPIGAVMSLLKNNTTQRDIKSGQLDSANNKIRCFKSQHVETLGRLFKYEGVAIIDEAYEYAKTNGMFVATESVNVGELSVIGVYENKSGKKSPAHFTKYGRFIEMAKEGNTTPKSYKGYFLMKDYDEKLKPLLNYTITEFSKIEDLFSFPSTEPVIDLVESLVGEDKNTDKKLKKCCVCEKMRRWRTEVIDGKKKKYWCAECIKTNWT